MQIANKFRGYLIVATVLLTIVSTAGAKYGGGTGEREGNSKIKHHSSFARRPGGPVGAAAQGSN